MAKNSVRAKEPKYARENGSLSLDMMCFRSAISSVPPEGYIGGDGLTVPWPV